MAYLELLELELDMVDSAREVEMGDCRLWTWEAARYMTLVLVSASLMDPGAVEINRGFLVTFYF